MRAAIISAAVLVSGAFSIQHAAHAAPINISDFSGSETVVSTTNLPGPETPVVVVGDVTFTSSVAFIKQISLTDISADGMFTMDLASPQNRVGFELNAIASSATGNQLITWTVQAFDAGMTLLEEIMVTQTALSTAVFAGFERSEGIVRLKAIEVTPGAMPSFNYFTLVNNVRFENTNPAEIPIPAALPLFLAGMAALGLSARRRRRSNRHGASK